MATYDLKELQKTFFEDPRWKGMEELILEFIEPLLDMTTIDTAQPAEAVKAEVIGRRIAYDRLHKFIEQSKMIGHSRPQITNSPFN